MAFPKGEVCEKCKYAWENWVKYAVVNSGWKGDNVMINKKA